MAVLRAPALGLAAAVISVLAAPALAAEAQPNLAQVGVTPTIQATNTGAGVKVAVLDGYADYDLNPDLTRNHGNVIVVYSGVYRYYSLHATHVSGIIGAAANGWGVVGIAPGATLYSIPVFDDRGWVPTDLGKRALDTGVSRGVKVVNMSYGPTAKGDVFLNGELNLFDDYLNSLLIVRAAGNSGVNAINEAYGGKASTSLANVLIVGSLDSQNRISYFSTRPGEACIAATPICAESEKMKYFTIVAPGEAILSDAPGSSLASLSGTSMATPTVVGGAALVIADGITKKVNLKPGEVASILKRSATDLGAPGVDGVFGWGLLNVTAALGPVGTTFVATGANVSNGGVSPGQLQQKVSPAFARGNVEKALAGSVFFDEYGRPFSAQTAIVQSDPTGTTRGLSVLAGGLGTAAVNPTGGNGLGFSYGEGMVALGGGVGVYTSADAESRWLLGFGQPLSYFSTAASDMGRFSGGTRLAQQYLTGFGAVTGGFDQSLFAAYDRAVDDRLSWNAVVLAGLGNSLALSSGQAVTAMPTANLASAGLTYKLSDRWSLAGSLGTLAESGSVLGNAENALYGLGASAVSGIANLNLGYAIDARRSVSFYADAARINPLGPAGALVTSATPLAAARVGVSFTQANTFSRGDQLTFTLGRPLTVTSGSETVRVATGREFDGTVDYETRTLDLGGARLPIEAGFAYTARSGALSYGVEGRIIDQDVAAAPKLDAHLNVALRISF